MVLLVAEPVEALAKVLPVEQLASAAIGHQFAIQTNLTAQGIHSGRNAARIAGNTAYFGRVPIEGPAHS